jgi:DNA processing protein
LRERDVLLGLVELEGIGWETIYHLVERTKSIQEVMEHSAKEILRGIPVIQTKGAKIDQFLTNDFIEGKLKFYERCGVDIVSFFDAEYPPLLRYAFQPPWILYVQGNKQLFLKDSVAIVGTRHPTPYGREVAEWFGAELAAEGIAVVSGLARGIDSAAHAGALRTTGETIAVLGNGLNVHYPPEHHKLQRAIAERGLIVSEYGWNTKPSKGSFPWRNRLIAGITRGTLVVEAAKKSGSLLTAQYAVQFNRDVFAVPGPITSPKSAGTYDLIRTGAMLAVHPSDILAEYGYQQLDQPNHEKTKLSEDEQELLEAMGAEAVTIDELARRTAQPFGHLHKLLLSLLVKKRIRALPGSAFIARLN